MLNALKLLHLIRICNRQLDVATFLPTYLRLTWVENNSSLEKLFSRKLPGRGWGGGGGSENWNFFEKNIKNENLKMEKLIPIKKIFLWHWPKIKLFCTSNWQFKWLLPIFSLQALPNDEPTLSAYLFLLWPVWPGDGIKSIPISHQVSKKVFYYGPIPACFCLFLAFPHDTIQI